MKSPFLDLPGAVEIDDAGVASHYGSPLAEQRALEDGVAVVDLSHRGVVLVTGEDRLSWLHSMTSQSLSALRPGESVETLLLDPNGRIETAIRIVDDGSTAWLLVDEGASGSLTEFLARMRFALRVEVRDAGDEYAAVLAFDGPASAALRRLGPAAEWRDPWAGTLAGGVQYAAAEHPARDWSAAQFVFPRESLAGVVGLFRSDRSDADLARDSGAADGAGPLRPAGLLALDALEVRAWRPSQHADVDERTIPHELDWLRTAVHLTKGCYRGQETVAKVHNLGHPPRRLVLLHLDGSGGELPVPGALVHPAGAGSGSRPVGRVTRAALHHEWGGIALALVKRSVAEDAPLEVRIGWDGADPAATSVETIAAAQEIIVPSDAGSAREIPRFRRL